MLDAPVDLRLDHPPDERAGREAVALAQELAADGRRPGPALPEARVLCGLHRSRRRPTERLGDADCSDP